MSSFKYPIPTQQFIHGEFVDAKGTQKVTLKSAVDDSVIVEDFIFANSEDVDIAVESAAKGLLEWQALTPAKRGEHLWNYATAIEKNAEQLGYLESILVGKPALFGGMWEPKTAGDLFRYFAGFCDKHVGEAPSDEEGFLRIVRNEPLGICAAINAFNSPIITFAMKAAPALAAGNVIISKASEFNPFSSLFLAQLAVEAGIPAGVLNVIVGAGEAGAALASHMKIRKISFTGSVATGKKVQIAGTNSNLKRVTLELGGKSPVIVFPDADLANAAQSGASFLALNGQGCVLGTRIYVHEDIADAYLAQLKAMVEHHASTLGADPFDMKTMSSPLYHPQQKEVVMRFLEQGKKEAETVTGGKSWGEKGHYVEPTIFFKPTADADIVKKEIFGPVVVVDTFKTEDEVLHKANDTEYGLGAAVFTKDIDRAIRFALKLEAGSVTVNNSQPFHPTVPFGGYKSSGVGRENGKAVLKEYSQTKSVHIK
ncbi:aldehyde dehydrogenase [Setomelanomma holmii]|uniref:aldehyde dehydrogenase (NAD(+)) n=1 Tax=Setomelanomma holmii TaxID=210430 RepID=A0A9P4LF44_9PLEO|nr:aldehyde dehydrogenase [Setomelanomma holmii]